MGTPSNKEMRKALAKAGGNIKTAEIAVFNERENKVMLGMCSHFSSIPGSVLCVLGSACGGFTAHCLGLNV